MSRDLHRTAEFEQRVHAVLDESVRRVGGHARSRLNQARHAAVAEAARRGQWSLPLRAAAWLRLHLWMPACGALGAAALTAFVLWPQAPRGYAPQGYPAAQTSQTSAEDLDLIADRDGMDIVQSGDGQFYEWAMAQASSGGPAGDTPAARGKTGDGQSAAPAPDSNPG